MEQKPPKILPYDSDVEEILFESYFYAIGRQTYMVSWTAEYLLDYLDSFSDEHLKAMIAEFERRDKLSADNDFCYLGDPKIDAPVWYDFCDTMRMKLINRHSPKTEIAIDDDFQHMLVSAIRVGFMSSRGRGIAKSACKFIQYCSDRMIFLIVKDIADAYRNDGITPVLPINDVNARAYYKLFTVVMKEAEKRGLLTELKYEVGVEKLNAVQPWDP